MLTHSTSRRMVWSLSGGEMVNCLTVWSDWLVSGSDTGQLDLRSPLTGTVEHREPVNIDIITLWWECL